MGLAGEGRFIHPVPEVWVEGGRLFKGASVWAL